MQPLDDAAVVRVVHHAPIHRLEVVVGLRFHTRRLHEGEKDVQTNLEGFRSHLVQSHVVNLQDAVSLVSDRIALSADLVPHFFIAVPFLNESIPIAGHFPLPFVLLDGD